MTNYIISQILVTLSSLIYCVSLLSKTKKRLLFFQIVSGFLFITQYIFVGAITGAVISSLDQLRVIIFYFIETKTKNSTIERTTASSIFIFLCIIATIFTWQGYISLLPFIASVVVCVGLAFKNLIVIKTIYLISNISTTTYMIFINSILGIITQALCTIINVIGLILIIKKHKGETSTNLKNNAQN